MQADFLEIHAVHAVHAGPDAAAGRMSHPATGHYRVECVTCHGLVVECGCPGDKDLTVGICDDCTVQPPRRTRK